VRRQRGNRATDRASSAWHFLPSGLAFLLLSIANCTAAAQAQAVESQAVESAPESQEAAQLLLKADSLKTSNHAEFAALVRRLEEQSAQLSVPQQQYLRYLKGWQNAYDGHYDAAIALLKTSIDESRDATLQFRAAATVINVLVLERQYEEAFAQLSKLLELLPGVSDRQAREQGLAIAASLYNQVGQYDLGLNYAEQLIEEGLIEASQPIEASQRGRGGCVGAQLRLEALYKSGKLRTVGGEFRKGIDACVKSGEPVYANAIRTFEVRLFIDQGKFDDAIALLKEHYDEVRRARYPRMISEYDALLAQCYRSKGNAVLTRTFASHAIESGVQSQYTEPMVSAYRLLYLLAQEQGDFRSALAFHEKYAAADKAYLDDVSVRQLAYQKVQHQGIANRLQIEALNKQNQVLQLERALGDKAVENSRLYIALLLLSLVFIAFWAYKTKRSQLHFMKRSQQDGLTGIANRPHFIDQADRVLEASSRAQQDVCVILCDLDQFKAINDRYGHAAGDFVLKQTVNACQTHLRANDLFGRLGGEEFGILLPGCNAEQARQRSEQLREAIAGISTSRGGMESGVSASFGIASTQTSSYELWQLLAHADAALYRAKRTGRNRVILFDRDGEIDAAADLSGKQARGFG
jgi:diguanylate cyclase (GGDEF)-like protein